MRTHLPCDHCSGLQWVAVRVEVVRDPFARECRPISRLERTKVTTKAKRKGIERRDTGVVKREKRDRRRLVDEGAGRAVELDDTAGTMGSDLLRTGDCSWTRVTVAAESIATAMEAVGRKRRA